MTSWRVAKYYGFGAAKIPLQAEAHRGRQGGLREGLVTMLSETLSGGPLAVMRRLAGVSPAIVLGLMLFVAFVVTLSKDRSDVSPVEIVMFETPAPMPEPIEIEEPPIEIAELKPEPRLPEFVPEVKPEPIPKPVVPKAPPPPKPEQLAKRPAPPPPVAKPRPKPVMPMIAKVEAPKPKPAVRPDRPVRERPQPVERAPRIALDQLRPEPRAATPAPERIARNVAPRPTAPRNTPRIAAPAAPAVDSETIPAPKRPFRVAAARPTAAERPKAIPGLAPAPRVRTATTVPPPRSNRASSPNPTASSRSRVAVPTLAVAAVPAAPTPARKTASRQTREMPTTSPSPVRRPAAALARPPKQAAARPAKIASRADRSMPTAPTGSAAERPGVTGVPLGDLAACVTDREEDRLKQAVVAAVKTQEQCVSRKGTYRFVETKNLNAFLMWIDRAASRPVEDRCAELLNALECLQGASQRAAR